MSSADQSEKVTQLGIKPTIIPRSQHPVSRALISDNALKILYRLKNAGYNACLVGGCVRDILLGREPKDFDVVTDARPEQIRELFHNCRLIGRRFRLAHVRFGNEIIEVSTFRASHHVSDHSGRHSEDGQILRDNVYGDIDDDVWRRDFTINALFYNIEDFSIIDYVGGIKDLEAGQLRLIGDAGQRYTEDPVRMLRAVRFAAKLDLHIHTEAEKTIDRHSSLLEKIPTARLFEETLKLFMGGYAVRTFELLRHYKLFKYLFPQTDHLLDAPGNSYSRTFIVQALENTDQRFNDGQAITPGFLLSILLWEIMRMHTDKHIANGLPEMEAVRLAGDSVISRQISSIAMPRRFTQMARDIWFLQFKLKRLKKRPDRVLAHPHFRSAYDFLLLRARAGESLQEQLAHWTREQNKAPPTKERNAQSTHHRPRSRRRRRQ